MKENQEWIRAMLDDLLLKTLTIIDETKEPQTVARCQTMESEIRRIIELNKVSR